MSSSDRSSAPSVPRRVLLLFVDGLGLGSDDPSRNPLLTYGGERLRPPFAGAAWRPLDATGGMPGLPQSATGQTTLLAGVNAPARVGGHRTGFPGPELRALLRERSLLRLLAAAGRRVAFLNAFRPLFWELTEAQRWRLSATTVATLAADLPFRSLDDLRAGRAVYHDVTNGELRRRGFAVPLRSPAAAGETLARNLLPLDFALFEFFRTDRAGHAGDRAAAEAVLRELDGFLGGVLEALAASGELARTLVLLTSDHGNIEDMSVRTHTRNRVPLAAWGAGAAAFTARTERLADVAGNIVELLVSGAETGSDPAAPRPLT